MKVLNLASDPKEHFNLLLSRLAHYTKPIISTGLLTLQPVRREEDYPQHIHKRAHVLCSIHASRCYPGNNHYKYRYTELAVHNQC